MTNGLQIIKPIAEVAGCQPFDTPTSYTNNYVGSITHEILARRQQGNVFILVIPARLIKQNGENVKFVLNQTDLGFDCTCENGKVV